MTRMLLIRACFVAVVAVAAATTFLPSSSAQKGTFSHATPKHVKACASCHTMPTSNWVAARGFPDVANFPGHAACFSCHTSAVLTGGKPTFCLGCHSNIAPGRAPMLKFPVATRPREFNIKFPHNVHQDILARVLRPDGVAVAHFVNASYVRADEKAAAFNSCAVCHVQADKLPKVDVPPIKDGLTASAAAAVDMADIKPAFFKTLPNGHQTCFTCHYTGISPAATDCKGCHTQTKAYKADDDIPRYSLKFDHTAGQHPEKDCMVCHVRIAQNADAAAMKDPDVPVMTCSTSACHGATFNGAKKGAENFWPSALANEIAARTKDATFQCTYCHATAVGRYQIPPSHQPPKK